MNPFTYRPADPGDKDWEDNRLSNAMAWASETFLPAWCANPDHWTSRLTNALWTDCYCCAALRWMAVGIIAGLVAGFIIGIAI